MSKRLSFCWPRFRPRLFRTPVHVLAMLILSISAFCAISGGTPALATAPAYRLQVSPTQANFDTLRPGDSFTGKFRIQNTGTKAYNYYLSVAPYSVADQTYNPNFTATSPYTELANWITIPVPTGSVEPGSNAEVSFTINVPADAPGNAQHAAIMITMETPDAVASSGFKTTRQVAFLIYGNISGATRSTGIITSNTFSSFLLDPPFTTSATVKNTGNINTVADFKLEVRSFMDGKILYTNADEKTGQVIFPETERSVELEWPATPALGLFRVKQTVTIFNETSVVERLIFICPMWFLLVLVTMAALIVIWFAQKITLLTHRTSRHTVKTPRPARTPRPVVPKATAPKVRPVKSPRPAVAKASPARTPRPAKIPNLGAKFAKLGVKFQKLEVKFKKLALKFQKRVLALPKRFQKLSKQLVRNRTSHRQARASSASRASNNFHRTHTWTSDGGLMPIENSISELALDYITTAPDASPVPSIPPLPDHAPVLSFIPPLPDHAPVLTPARVQRVAAAPSPAISQPRPTVPHRPARSAITAPSLRSTARPATPRPRTGTVPISSNMPLLRRKS